MALERPRTQGLRRRSKSLRLGIQGRSWREALDLRMGRIWIVTMECRWGKYIRQRKDLEQNHKNGEGAKKLTLAQIMMGTR